MWVRRGGEHSKHELMTADGGKYAKYYEGGGSFERALAGPYKRYLMSHNAKYESTGYRVNNGEGFAKDTEFREYTDFTSPFDIAGTSKILVVARSRNRDTVYYGPNGWAVKDDYALRLPDVMKQIPKRSNHPYSKKFIHVDRESGESYYANAFDKAGELWKVWQLTKVWSDDAWVQNNPDKFNKDPARYPLPVVPEHQRG